MTFKPARNYYTDPVSGYVTYRYICEHAPTNRVRPRHLLQDHGYYSFGIGNGAGARYAEALRAKTCPKCGGKMIPIHLWRPAEEVVNA